jgi:hypothetical protein
MSGRRIRGRIFISMFITCRFHNKDNDIERDKCTCACVCVCTEMIYIIYEFVTAKANLCPTIPTVIKASRKKDTHFGRPGKREKRWRAL